MRCKSRIELSENALKKLKVAAAKKGIPMYKYLEEIMEKVEITVDSEDKKSEKFKFSF